MKLTAQFVDVPDLSADDRRDMLRLMGRHYDNVCPQAFVADLSEKRWVIVVRYRGGQMQGFCAKASPTPRPSVASTRTFTFLWNATRGTSPATNCVASPGYRAKISRKRRIVSCDRRNSA